MFAPASFSPSGGCHIKREAFVSASVYSLDDGIAARHYATSVCVQHNPCRDSPDYVLAAARDNASSSLTRVF